MPLSSSDKKNPPSPTFVIPDISDDMTDTDVSISFIKRMKGEDLGTHDLETILKFCAERTPDEIKETKISRWLMNVKNWFGR